MKLPSVELQEYIEGIIATRLESSVDYSHVLRWLDNFEDQDQSKAISVLSKIEYFSYNKILRFISGHLESIDAIGYKRIFIMPIGNAGKSGGLIQYACQQILKGKGNYIFIKTFNDIASKDFSEHDAILLVDDIVGSGQTLIDWLMIENQNNEYGELLSRLIEQSQVNIMSIVVMRNGLRKIQVKFPTIRVFAEERNKAFERVDSPFGGSVSMLPYRDFCYKYGVNLSHRNPLGFGNAQALIVFDHASPNNTLPIIWSNSKTQNGKSWYPLYPRFTNQRIKQLEDKDKDNRKCLVQIRELFGYDNVTKQLFATTNLYLLEMLTLKMKNMSDYSIAQKLSLPSNDLNTLWQEGITLGFWDSSHNITSTCKKRYDEIIKEIRFKRTEEQNRQYKSQNIENDYNIYIPETFRGVK